ncbi:hypothetical protein [Pararobbsia alpina]|uniref:Uncharacterized protein n=1 Tax=Pararobbsia alpina TaxID=621374 RepID=A0A6S7AYL5_9BURK|nr:hypothetical protein [Pararobbsia alpina]CAB3781860.1 hypothetical protein LMG28138_01370 [Pararobbsia alpina]
MKKTAKRSWADIKGQLSTFDRAGLLGLVQDLYAASKDSQAFLHARFGIGDDVLKPYKSIIDRCVWPDVFKNQAISVSKAKKAISDYRKAIGRPEGLAELMVFYCERATGFCNDVGMENDVFFAALVRMYEQALQSAVALSNDAGHSLVARLDEVRRASSNFGYGVSDDMNILFAEYVPDDR